MAIKISRIGFKFALLLAGAAVVPLLAYGFVSILSLQRGTRESIVSRQPERRDPRRRGDPPLRRHQRRAAQGAGGRPAGHRAAALAAGADPQELRAARSASSARSRCSTRAAGRSPRAASASRASSIPSDSPLAIDGVSMSPIRVDEDLLPTSVFAIHLTRLNQPAGLAGRRVQPRRNVADGRSHPHRRAWLRAGRRARRRADRPRRSRQEGAGRARAQHAGPSAGADARAQRPATRRWRTYYDDGGRSQLGVATRIAALGWTVIVEQPTAEAYANATAAPAAAGRGHLRRRCSP